jgi:hypothetical protein
VPGSGLDRRVGRGAPELDLVAKGPGSALAVGLAVAPGVEGPGRPVAPQRPAEGSEWYRLELSPPPVASGVVGSGVASSVDASSYGGLTCGSGDENPGADELACLAPYTADRIAAALRWADGGGSSTSRTSNVSSDGGGGAGGFHVYRLEWEPGSSLAWRVDGVRVLGLDQAALHAAAGANIPQEPMYLFAGAPVAAALSPDDDEGERPGAPPGAAEVLAVDYVRVYQAARHGLGCSPDAYPTQAYVARNPALFAAWVPKLTPFDSSKSTIQLFSVLLPGLTFAAMMACFVFGVRGLRRTVHDCWRRRGAETVGPAAGSMTERSGLVAHGPVRVELATSGVPYAIRTIV